MLLKDRKTSINEITSYNKKYPVAQKLFLNDKFRETVITYSLSFRYYVTLTTDLNIVKMILKLIENSTLG